MHSGRIAQTIAPRVSIGARSCHIDGLSGTGRKNIVVVTCTVKGDGGSCFDISKINGIDKCRVVVMRHSDGGVRIGNSSLCNYKAGDQFRFWQSRNLRDVVVGSGTYQRSIIPRCCAAIVECRVSIIIIGTRGLVGKPLLAIEIIQCCGIGGFSYRQ